MSEELKEGVTYWHCIPDDGTLEVVVATRCDGAAYAYGQKINLIDFINHGNSALIGAIRDAAEILDRKRRQLSENN